MSGSVTPERWAELLRIARRSRIKWILEAREVESDSAGTGVSTLLSESVKTKVPAAECIQKVLNYLSDVVEDGEVCDINAVAVGLIDYEEFDTMPHSTGVNDRDYTTTGPNKVQDHSKFDLSYNGFINALLHPAATEIVKSIQQFVTKFFTNLQESRRQQSLRPEEEEYRNWSGGLWDFLDTHVYPSMRRCPLWSEEGAGLGQQDFEKHVQPHCEKFLFTKLHPMLFGSDVEDAHLDAHTRERVAALDFLSAEHLDIRALRPLYQQYKLRQQKKQKHQEQHANRQSGRGNSGDQSDSREDMAPRSKSSSKSTSKNSSSSSSSSNSSSSSSRDDEAASEQAFLREVLQPAMEPLGGLATARCPRDKLDCVRRCSMAIAALLKDSRSDGSLPGADELLPVMILTLKLCNPPQLHSNLKYLQRYLRPKQLVSEAGYLLTNFVSAVFFLDNVDAKALTIEPDEFERSMRLSRQRARDSQQAALLAAKNSAAAAATVNRTIHYSSTKYKRRNNHRKPNESKSGVRGRLAVVTGSTPKKSLNPFDGDDDVDTVDGTGSAVEQIEQDDSADESDDPDLLQSISEAQGVQGAQGLPVPVVCGEQGDADQAVAQELAALVVARRRTCARELRQNQLSVAQIRRARSIVQQQQMHSQAQAGTPRGERGRDGEDQTEPKQLRVAAALLHIVPESGSTMPQGEGEEQRPRSS